VREKKETLTYKREINFVRKELTYRLGVEAKPVSHVEL